MLYSTGTRREETKFIVRLVKEKKMKCEIFRKILFNMLTCNPRQHGVPFIQLKGIVS
jgi:hypothetical protein